MNWYLKVLKQYADFDGRARRKEFWMFALFNLIISYALFGIFAAIGSAIDNPSIMFVSYIYSLGVLIPNIAVTVRRLHDIGKSGWYILISLIPLVGAILLIVWLCKDSEPGTNEYGPNPKDPDTELNDIGASQL